MRAMSSPPGEGQQRRFLGTLATMEANGVAVVPMGVVHTFRVDSDTATRSSDAQIPGARGGQTARIG